jgi:hypothetical protein
MDFGKSLVADSKMMEIMKPGMSTFDYPSILPESAAMLSAALCENRFNAPFAQFLSVCFGVVSAVSIDDLGLSQRVAANATDDWNRVDQRQQLCDVVTIGTGQDNRERHPVCVSSDMVLRAGPRTIYGVRPSFWPAPIARTEDESTTTRDKSICPTRLLLASRVSGANRSPRSRNPFRRVDRANVALCVLQTQCRSMPRGRVPACDLDTSRVEPSALAVRVRFVSIIRRQ